MENLKIACIGTGAMGGAILSSICKKYNPQNITVADKNTESAKNFAQKNNCNFKYFMRSICVCRLVELQKEASDHAHRK